MVMALFIGSVTTLIKQKIPPPSNLITIRTDPHTTFPPIAPQKPTKLRIKGSFKEQRCQICTLTS
jgi:hypothetical protein